MSALPIPNVVTTIHWLRKKQHGNSRNTRWQQQNRQTWESPSPPSPTCNSCLNGFHIMWTHPYSSYFNRHCSLPGSTWLQVVNVCRAFVLLPKVKVNVRNVWLAGACSRKEQSFSSPLLLTDAKACLVRWYQEAEGPSGGISHPDSDPGMTTNKGQSLCYQPRKNDKLMFYVSVLSNLSQIEPTN